MIKNFSANISTMMPSNLATKKSSNESSKANGGDYASVIAAQIRPSLPANSDAIRQQKINDQANAALASAGSGLRCALTSTTDIYKNQVLKALTGSCTDDVRLDQLTTQVVTGGGSEAQADGLYKIMDINNDGRVSAQEFKDSLTDPFAKSTYEQKLADATAKSNSTALHLFQKFAEMPELSHLLADMAKE